MHAQALKPGVISHRIFITHTSAPQIRPNLKVQMTTDTIKTLFRKVIRGLAISLRGPSASDKVLEITPLETPLLAIFSPSIVVFTVPIHRCSNPYFDFYAPAANNTYVETIRDYMDGRHTRYEGSRLYRYYEQCRLNPQNDPFRQFSNTLAKMMPSFHTTNGRLPPFPWDSTVVRPKQVPLTPKTQESSGHLLYPHEKASENFTRLVRVYESIREKGYQPNSSPDGEIQGFFLKNRDDYRFIIKAGMHRTAVLSAMGHVRIRVTFLPNSFRVIDIADLELLPQVRGGLYEPEIARKFFMRYFI